MLHLMIPQTDHTPRTGRHVMISSCSVAQCTQSVMCMNVLLSLTVTVFSVNQLYLLTSSLINCWSQLHSVSGLRPWVYAGYLKNVAPPPNWKLQIVDNSYLHISTFFRVTWIFHQMALIFPRVAYPSLSLCQLLSTLNQPENENAAFRKWRHFFRHRVS